MKLLPFLGPALLLLASAQAASAATGDIAAEFNGPGNGLVGLGGLNRSAGTTFRAQIGGPVESIDLSLRLNGQPNPILNVTFWELDGAGLPGTALGQATFTPTLVSGVFQWFTCDASASGVMLTAGTDYAWTLTSEPGTGGWMAETRTGGGAYPDGRGIVKLASFWEFMAQNFAFGERDVLFRVRVGGGSGSAYCFGDGSTIPCPCGAVGVPGEGCPTSSGSGARLIGSGSADVAADTFELQVSGAPAFQPGLFLQGMAPGAVPVGDGILCIQSQLRYPVLFLDSTGAASTAGTSLGAFATAGVTMRYQFWCRDPLGSCGNGSNLSNAWQVTWR